MGPGSAVHLSNLNEPFHQLLKNAATVHTNYDANRFVHVFQAALKHNLTASVLSWTADSWCSSSPVLNLFRMAPELRNFIFENLPWALKYNAARFPFFMPSQTGLPTARCITGLSRQRSLSHQRAVCAFHSRGPVDLQDDVPEMIKAECHDQSGTLTTTISPRKFKAP